MRRFAIGDVHGCAKALRSLIEAIDPQADDELVFMGDYVDRGPDSKDVVDQIIELSERCRVIALRGNHEIMLLSVALCGMNDVVWINNGGRATVTSYGGCLSKIPARHLEFLQRLRPYYETTDAIFVHACYQPLLDMHEQDELTNYWTHLPHALPLPHRSGKRVFVGHTPQGSGNVLDAGYLVCLDTYCFGGKYLTAFNVNTDEVIQTDLHGHLRRPPTFAVGSPLAILFNKVRELFRRNSEPTGIEVRRGDIATASLEAE
jgi:serine/threonine protein phosphatase 1